MGWVEDRFQNEADFKKFVPQLWNAMRDSIGVAISEFNSHMGDKSGEHLEATDCTSMGTYCRRVTRGSGPISIEIFLNAKTRTLTARQDGATLITVCGYRIRHDRTGGEFFLESTGDSIEVDIACRGALETFIFGRV